MTKKHPNKLPFEGVLTKLDQPSDKAPSGSRGHRVVLTSEAAAEALDSLIDMGVGYKTGWDGHDARQKCGVITSAEIVGDELRVAGHLYARDFPEVLHMAEKGPMGMSYEMCDAHVEDMRSKVWRLTHVTFTGAAILLTDKAAYQSTRFTINAAAEEKFNGCLMGVGEVEVKR